MDAKKKSDHRVAVKLILDFTGKRPSGMSDANFVATIIYAVVGGVMDQTITFLDKYPRITGIEDKTQLREHIMNGAAVALTEQLCAVWRLSGHEREKLPQFVNMQAALYEETYAPNVGDIGHA